MKKLAITTLVLFAGFFANAQEETRKLSSFSEISVQEAIDAYIKSGDKEEIRIRTNGNIDLDEVLAEVSGGKLKIHLAGNRHRNVDVKVWITYKKINEINVSTAASLQGENEVIASGDFDIEVTTAGELELALIAEDVDINVNTAGDMDLTLEADNLEIQVGTAGSAKLDVNLGSIDASVVSAGDVWVKGLAKVQDINVRTSGDYDADDMSSEEAEIDASTGGTARVNVSKLIDARASTGGDIRYKGNPEKVYVNSSTGGSIKKY